jgi:hypothetical protein
MRPIDEKAIRLSSPAKSPIETVNFLDVERATAAIALYNDIRTSLQASGWTEAPERTTPGYWWHHPDHPGTFAMSAAHGQWRLDIEAQKRER